MQDGQIKHIHVLAKPGCFACLFVLFLFFIVVSLRKGLGWSEQDTSHQVCIWREFQGTQGVVMVRGITIDVKTTGYPESVWGGDG